MIISELGLATFVTFASLVFIIVVNRFIKDINVKLTINFMKRKMKEYDELKKEIDS